MKISLFNVGDVLNSIQLEPVTRLELIKYAGASGDYNPIHTIDDEAINAGLPGVIAHGMLTMGRMGSLFTPYVLEGFVQEFSTRFIGMVFLQDVITLKATLVEKNYLSLYFLVEAVNQREEKIATGKVTFQTYS
jgi:acyl dehydratase